MLLPMHQLMLSCLGPQFSASRGISSQAKLKFLNSSFSFQS